MIRVPRFVLACLSLTLLALFYVWQQTEVFRLAYVGQKKLTHFEELLDENSSLRYNLTRKTSVASMGTQVTADSGFHMPDQYCLLRLPQQRPAYAAGSRQSDKKETLIARLFGIRREAEAHTITPVVTFSSQPE